MRAGIGSVMLLTLLAAIAWDAQSQLSAPLPLGAPVTVLVERGSGLGTLLRDWQSRGILESARQRQYLRVWARLRGQAGQIKSGEYELQPGLSAVGLIDLLVSGRSVLHELRVTEGWRFDQMMAAIQENPVLRKSLPAFDGETVMAALGHPGMHPEGRFYPDTYRFQRGTTDLAFLQRAFAMMETALEAEWNAREEGLPYRDANDALTMASIVERETGVPDERAHVAGVFVRRLRIGMRLQTDPTVIYGLGAAFDGNLRKVDLLRDTPWNTYTRKGLPRSPICLPGRAAIRAALHPAPGETLYFVARRDGTHEFSVTFAQHDAAVRKYQLRRSRPKKDP